MNQYENAIKRLVDQLDKIASGKGTGLEPAELDMKKIRKMKRSEI